MKKISILLVLLLVFAVNAYCVPAKIKLNLEKKGSYIYWFTYTDAASGKDIVESPVRFKGGDTEIELPAVYETAKKLKLRVMSVSNSLMAIVDLAKPEKPKAIDLTKDDFSYIHNVKLKIVSEDAAPLENALVKITDGESNELSAVVTPADLGIAQFYDVAVGEINVKVKSEGLKKTIDSDFMLEQPENKAAFEQDIKVSGDVHTLAVEAEKPSKESKSKGKNAPSGISGLLQTLSGLFFVIIVIVIIFAILKAKGITAKNALGKVGVILPEEPQTIPATGSVPAIDPNMCQFCGQMRDAAGKCACTLGASPFAGASATSSDGPRLIGAQGVYSGHIFKISGASAVMGREAGNDIPLPNDTTSSRRHALISNSGGVFSIKDEGSSNGIFVNGVKINEQKLNPGDEIQVGGTKFRFEI